MDNGPTIKGNQMAGSEKVHEHTEASNTKLEAMIAKSRVPKTKAMLLQQEELIEFRGPKREMLIVLCPRSMVMCKISLRLALEQDSGNSAMKLSPSMDQTTTQANLVKENQEGPSMKGKAKCLKRKSPNNPKLLMNFIILNARGQQWGI